MEREEDGEKRNRLDEKGTRFHGSEGVRVKDSEQSRVIVLLVSHLDGPQQREQGDSSSNPEFDATSSDE